MSKGKNTFACFPMIPFAGCVAKLHATVSKSLGITMQRVFAEILPKFVGNKFSRFVSTYKWAKCWSQRRAQQKWCCKWHFFNETFTKWSMSLINLVNICFRFYHVTPLGENIEIGSKFGGVDFGCWWYQVCEDLPKLMKPFKSFSKLPKLAAGTRSQSCQKLLKAVCTPPKARETVKIVEFDWPIAGIVVPLAMFL